MELITAELRADMLENGRKSPIIEDFDPLPVVKLFAPWTNATWLLTELDPNDPDVAFGLCDLGVGGAELGCVYLPELRELSGPGGLRVERDLLFKPDHPISWYADRAFDAGCIVY